MMTPTLDYSPERKRLTRRVVWLAAIATLLVLFALSAFFYESLQRRIQQATQARQAAQAAAAFRRFDANVPGAIVHFEGKQLGPAPQLLSKADCVRLGLPVADAGEMDIDGWGEGVPLLDPATGKFPRVTYELPPAVAAKYLSVETPWGPRVKCAGGATYPNGVEVNFMARGQDGLLLDVAFNPDPAASDDAVVVTLTLTNIGTTPLKGLHPKTTLFWAPFDREWNRRAGQSEPLPATWSTLAPGQQVTTQLSLPMPKESGDYIVFAIFSLFEDDAATRLAGRGSIYSDSKWLRVRRDKVDAGR